MEHSRTLLAPLLVAAALATMGAAPVRKDPCRGDARRLCQDVPPGAGPVIACLKAHDAQLSPACRQRFAMARERSPTFVKACKADTNRLCPGVAPGAGRIVTCLKSKVAELSPGCRAETTR